MKYIAIIDGQEFEIEINVEDEIIANGERVTIDYLSVAGQPVYSLIVDGRSYEALVQPTEDGMEVLLQGQHFSVSVEDERQRRLRQTSGPSVAKSGELHMKSPMPGLIISVKVREGQEIDVGDSLIVLESMKMQNELKAPCEGTIRSLRIKSGDNVEQNQILLTIG
ncbi:MAG: biotin/lipoyl-binding protein [Anaerolineales bacterium]|nr:biotin/lipoyl-binding protein [Anaerolineales bacterium]